MSVFNKNEKNLTCKLNLYELDNGNDYETYAYRVIDESRETIQAVVSGGGRNRSASVNPPSTKTASTHQPRKESNIS